MASTIELIPNPNQNNILYPNSRYNYHLIYTDPDTHQKFIESFKIPDIPAKQSDLTYTITAGNAFRPDLIAYLFYDTPLLWWAIAVANDVINPLDRTDGFYSGRVLRIPDKNSVVLLGI